MKTVLLGDLVKSKEIKILNKLRAPLNSRQRAERQGTYPYYGATGQMDSIDEYKFDGRYVLVAEDGTVYGRNGRSPMIQKVQGKFWVSNHAHVMQGADDTDTDYLALALEGVDIHTQITGAVQLKLSKDNLLKTKIYFPVKAERKKLLDMIGPIDEKIELNRQMNVTLEQIGQALFGHYFINNPESKTWPVGKVSDLGTVITGKTPSKKRDDFFEGEILFLKIPDMHDQSMIIKTEDSLTEAGASSQSNKTLPRHSTCVSCIATVGLVSLTTENAQTNQQINSIVPTNNYRFYNYFLMLTMSDNLRAIASGGTATLNLNKGQFENIKVVLPPDDLLEEFDNLVSPIINQLENNLIQNEGLVDLRDSLLPRLISGKIKV